MYRDGAPFLVSSSATTSHTGRPGLSVTLRSVSARGFAARAWTRASRAAAFAGSLTRPGAGAAGPAQCTLPVPECQLPDKRSIAHSSNYREPRLPVAGAAPARNLWQR
jgi:hypothetical protein